MARIDTDSLIWGGILGAGYIVAPEADKSLGTTGKILSVKNAVEIGAPVAGILMQAFNFKADIGIKLTRAGTAMAVKSLYELLTTKKGSGAKTPRTVAARQLSSAGVYDVR